ncbi:unnamed protein product [Rangifer tarandus platyrhynchus]|uniref:Uncharacterized protein n=1 Tax=Rangifer tarandus platyrhynchus TaxID=3082113 RepID=A0AC59Y446_RANTA
MRALRRGQGLEASPQLRAARQQLRKRDRLPGRLLTCAKVRTPPSGPRPPTERREPRHRLSQRPAGPSPGTRPLAPALSERRDWLKRLGKLGARNRPRRAELPTASPSGQEVSQ